MKVATPLEENPMEENPNGGAKETDANIRFLDLVAQLAGAITAATVLFSVLYNWAYFETVYPSALQLFTIGDHIASAIEFLPATVASAVVGGLFGYFGFIGKLIPKKKNPKPYSPDEWKKVRRTQYVFWSIIFLGFGGFLQLLSPPGLWIFAISTILTLWMLFGHDVLAKMQLRRKMQIFVYFIPLYCAIAVMYGNGRAIGDLSNTDGTTRVILADHTVLDNMVVLRYLDKGIILRPSETNAVLYEPWGQIEEISTLGIKFTDKVRACIWFGIGCGLHQSFSHN